MVISQGQLRLQGQSKGRKGKISKVETTEKALGRDVVGVAAQASGVRNSG